MKKALLFLPLLFVPYVYPIQPDIIVFDFGGVVGYTDYDVYTKKIQKRLCISHSKAKSMVRKARESNGVYWQHYSIRYGQYLPFDLPQEAERIRKLSMRIEPEIKQIINELKQQGYQVALLSNINKSRAKLIRKLGLYKPFNPVVLSCDIKTEKPHKKAYKVLLKKLGNVRPERCFFIDDKQTNIDAAARLGIQGVVFQSPQGLRTDLALRNILPIQE